MEDGRNVVTWRWISAIDQDQKMNNRNRKNKRIRIRYGDRCVHIPNDEALYDYLKRKPGAEYHLADHILRTYRNRYEAEFHITRESFATEIRWHVRIYRWMKKMHVPGKRLHRRMNVIDCGEREVDNNRFVWDLISMSHFR